MLSVIAFDKARTCKNQATAKPPIYSSRFPKKNEAVDLHVACLESDYFSAFGRRECHMGEWQVLWYSDLLRNRYHLGGLQCL